MVLSNVCSIIKIDNIHCTVYYKAAPIDLLEKISVVFFDFQK